MTGAVADAAAALRAAGLPLRAAAPGANQESARVARLLVERELRRVGLVPAGPDVAVPAIALELAGGLAEQRGPIAVVDAQGTWPCAAELAKAPVAPGRLATTARVSERLALVTPTAPVVHAAHLGRILAQELAGYAVLLVDLTGYHERGELPAACEHVDALALVARSGSTRLREVMRWLEALPADRLLGVLLTGAEPAGGPT